MDDRKTPSFIISRDISRIEQDISEDPLKFMNHDRGNEILIISIDIGDGRHDQLVVCENDNPDDVVFEFCEKHNLNLNIQTTLLQQIIDIIPEEASTAITPEKKKEHKNINSNSTTSAIINYSHRPIICEKSKKIADGKFRESNVYQRLYQIPKKMSNPNVTSPSKYKIRPKTQNHKNIGDILYQKGLKSKEKTNTNIQLQRQQKVRNEMREVTFRPNTTASKSPIRKTPENDLLRKGTQLKLKMNKLREERKYAELDGCTFSPAINRKNSSKSLEPTEDRCFLLYKKSNSIREIRENAANEIMKKECPFEPNTFLSRTSLKTYKKSLNRSGSSSSRHNLEEYLEEKKYKEKFDPETKQKLFHPKIGRPPHDRKISPDEIGDYLFSKSFRTPTVENTIKPILICPNSEKILKKMKKERFKEIFEKLCPDESGRINIDTISKSDLKPTIMAIIDPLVSELRELNENLDFDEFFDSMNALLKRMTPGERTIILQINKMNKTESNSPVSNISRSYNSSDFYSREMLRLESVHNKIEEIRASQRAIEESECTFKPKLEAKYKGSQSKEKELSVIDL